MNLPQLKARLTRLLRVMKAAEGEDVVTSAVHVMEECNKAYKLFEKHGYPDCHHDWERAKDDAQLQIDCQCVRLI